MAAAIERFYFQKYSRKFPPFNGTLMATAWLGGHLGVEIEMRCTGCYSELMKSESTNATNQPEPTALEGLENARMIAAKELFDAMAMNATNDVLDAIDLKHKPIYDALRKVRGTALPKDIADQLFPLD